MPPFAWLVLLSDTLSCAIGVAFAVGFFSKAEQVRLHILVKKWPCTLYGKETVFYLDGDCTNILNFSKCSS